VYESLLKDLLNKLMFLLFAGFEEGHTTFLSKGTTFRNHNKASQKHVFVAKHGCTCSTT